MSMKIKFGPLASSEIEVMLESSEGSGCEVAKSIRAKRHGDVFDLTNEEAAYLVERLYNDAERVAEACGPSAGRAFERAGDKLDGLLRQTTGTESSAANSSPQL